MTPPNEEFDPLASPNDLGEGDAASHAGDSDARDFRTATRDSNSTEPSEPGERACHLGLDDTFERLAPQQVRFEQRVGYITAAVLMVVAVVVTVVSFFNFQSEWWYLPALVLSWGLFLGLTVFYAHFWPQVDYKYTGYRLGEAGMEIQRGVFWRHKISIPLARVQHVDVSQGPVQRMFDLGTLTVHTAGTKNASIELSGLEHQTAVQLRDRLIEQRETLDVT